MILTADYHTHTIYSHGKGTVMDNALQAKKIGLKEIGITDHGFGQIMFGLRHKKMPQLIADCREATEKTGVKVLVGIEADLMGEGGETDLKESDYPDFDLFLMGIHIFIRYSSLRDIFRFMLPNLIDAKLKLKPSASTVRTTTNAYINAIEKNPIDVITHLNFLNFSDPVEVAKAARDNGTYIELNSKKTHLTDEELAAVRDTGVRFVVNSDAHSVDRIGDTVRVETQLSRVEIPASQIDNIDGKLPSFRFAAYKKEHGLS